MKADHSGIWFRILLRYLAELLLVLCSWVSRLFCCWFKSGLIRELFVVVFGRTTHHCLQFTVEVDAGGLILRWRRKNRQQRRYWNGWMFYEVYELINSNWNVSFWLVLPIGTVRARYALWRQKDILNCPGQVWDCSNLLYQEADIMETQSLEIFNDSVSCMQYCSKMIDISPWVSHQCWI